jgi:ketosteroid isomerase-like protein
MLTTSIMPALRLLTLAGAALLYAGCALPTPQPRALQATPRTVIDELLATDRAFAAASARTDVISGLSAMFAENVIMPVPGNRFAEGRSAAIEALRANADNARSRVAWTPIRAGISADGQHGFTFGYMTLHGPDGSTVPLKYMSYWIRQADGWRVAGYKRRQAPHVVPEPSMMASSLPRRLVAVTTDTAVVARHRASLDRAERDFSRDAQRIGLRAAFMHYGRDDAVNMGRPNEPGFIVGATAIGQAVGAGTADRASPVSWAPDRVLVASSGDLGITFGMIRPNAPQTAGTGTPFFTIWRRTDASQPWRYIAE